MPARAGILIRVLPVIGEIVQVASVRDQDDLGVWIAVPNQLANFLAQKDSSVAGAGLDGATVRAVAILQGLDVPAILDEGEVDGQVVLGYNGAE